MGRLGLQRDRRLGHPRPVLGDTVTAAIALVCASFVIWAVTARVPLAPRTVVVLQVGAVAALLVAIALILQWLTRAYPR